MWQYRKVKFRNVTKNVTQLHSLTVLLHFLLFYSNEFSPHTLPHSEHMIHACISNNYDCLAIRIFCTSLIFTLIELQLLPDLVILYHFLRSSESCGRSWMWWWMEESSLMEEEGEKRRPVDWALL